MAQETEDRKRTFDDDEAAQELAGEEHGVKSGAEELGEQDMSPKSERMYPPTYAGNVKRVRKEYDGDEPQMLITDVLDEDEIDKEEMKKAMRSAV